MATRAVPAFIAYYPDFTAGFPPRAALSSVSLMTPVGFIGATRALKADIDEA